MNDTVKGNNKLRRCLKYRSVYFSINRLEIFNTKGIIGVETSVYWGVL